MPAATDALFAGVALSDRAVDRRRCQPAGGRGRLRGEWRDRVPAVAALPGGRLVGVAGSAAGAAVRQPRRLSAQAEAEILEARSYAHAGPVIVAGLLGRPASTVWKVLRRHGVSRLPRAPREPREPREPIQRYERARPGELVHVDIKRLGRFWTVGKAILGDRLNRSEGAGWQYLHLAIDDHSRLAYAELLRSESPADCVAFLRRAVAW